MQLKQVIIAYKAGDKHNKEHALQALRLKSCLFHKEERQEKRMVYLLLDIQPKKNKVPCKQHKQEKG